MENGRANRAAVSFYNKKMRSYGHSLLNASCFSHRRFFIHMLKLVPECT